MKKIATIKELKTSFKVEMFHNNTKVARNYFSKSASAISFCHSNGYEIKTYNEK